MVMMAGWHAIGRWFEPCLAQCRLRRIVPRRQLDGGVATLSSIFDKEQGRNQSLAGDIAPLLNRDADC